MSNRKVLFISGHGAHQPRSPFCLVSDVWGWETGWFVCVCNTDYWKKQFIQWENLSAADPSEGHQLGNPKTKWKQNQVLALTVSLQKAQWFSKSLNFKWMHFHLKYLFYTYIDRYTHIYTHIYIFRLGHPFLLHASSCRPCKVRAMYKYLFITSGISQQSAALQSNFHCVITPCVQKLLKV